MRKIILLSVLWQIRLKKNTIIVKNIVENIFNVCYNK